MQSCRRKKIFMPRKLEAYIEEILETIAMVESFLSGLDFDSYTNDNRTKAAVERKLLNIGEALNQMNSVANDLENKITDFKKIVGFRNILVHGYFGVDDALVWDVVTNKLDQLRKDINEL